MISHRPHRQGGCLACCGCIPAEVALIYTMQEALKGALPMRLGGATSQLDLLSLTSLSVAGCG